MRSNAQIVVAVIKGLDTAPKDEKIARKAVAQLLKEMDNGRYARFLSFLKMPKKGKEREMRNSVLENVRGIKPAFHKFVSSGEPFSEHEGSQILDFLALWEQHVADEKITAQNRKVVEVPRPEPRKTSSVRPGPFAR